MVGVAGPHHFRGPLHIKVSPMNDTSLFERLEDRTLLTVSATFGAKRSILTLNGSAGADNVEVFGTGIFGEVRVIDGAFDQTFVGVKSITADLGAGDDTFAVSGISIGGSVSVNLGLGADRFSLDHERGAFTAPVFIGGSVTANFGANAGDFAEWDTGAALSNLGIRIGGDVTFTAVADVDFDGNGTSPANQPEDINIGGALKVTLIGAANVGGNAAQLYLDDVNVGGRTILNGSDFAETIRMGDCSFARPVEIALKGGDDVFDIDEPNFNRFNNTLNVNYGLGSDTFDTNAGNFFAFGTNSKNGPEVII
jgi:hypothetical protein